MSPRRADRTRPPVATYVVIGLCAAVFLAGPLSGLGSGPAGTAARLCEQALYFDRWGVIPAELWHGLLPPRSLGLPAGCHAPPQPAKTPFWSVLTALFVHAGWAHLLGNMLFLYVFGAGVEERMGSLRFTAFYLAAGYLAGYGFAVGHPGSTEPLVGASGAISGVLGAYLYLYPASRVTSLFPFLLFLPLRFPAWLVLGFWFALQWLAARAAPPGPGIAYAAHLIGFTFGFLCSAVCYRRRRRTAAAPAAHPDAGGQERHEQRRRTATPWQDRPGTGPGRSKLGPPDSATPQGDAQP